MSLEVLGAGFGRTGTFSIKLALEQLGFGPCLHMEDVFTDEAQLPRWQAAVTGAPVDWQHALSGFRSCVDWPTTHYWQEIAAEFPAARVLLHVRSEDDWWESFSRSVRPLIERRSEVPDAHRRNALEMAHQMIEIQTFDGKMADKEHVLSVYRRRIAQVRKTIAADRLLVFDVTQGWEPLCKFLDVPIPDGDFPRENNLPAFWEFFGEGLESSDYV